VGRRDWDHREVNKLREEPAKSYSLVTGQNSVKLMSMFVSCVAS